MCRFASITDWGHLDLGSVLLLLGIKSYASGIWQLVRREYVKCETSSFGAVWQLAMDIPLAFCASSPARGTGNALTAPDTSEF